MPLWILVPLEMASEKVAIALFPLPVKGKRKLELKKVGGRRKLALTVPTRR